VPSDASDRPNPHAQITNASIEPKRQLGIPSDQYLPSPPHDNGSTSQ
jgi:hypothetical protein